MAILFNNAAGNQDGWLEALSQYLPDIPLHLFPHDKPEEIKYAVIWNHPAGDLKRYPNLRAILNLGAGTDYLELDQELPPVPVVRLVDPVVDINMAHYTLYWLMHFHRDYEQYRRKQGNKDWSRFSRPQASEFRVSVLGLGLIGQYIAEYLAKSGFQTSGWNRSKRSIDLVKTYAGEDELRIMLAQTDVLINCLPLKLNTRQFIGHEIFKAMPKGGYFINISRGGVVHDQQLIESLDSKQLNAAALDTFTVEPLPNNSPYWQHPKVYVTPHISGATYASTSAKVIADNILRLEKGESPFPIYPQFPFQDPK